jgi:hypothetical protein
LRGVRRDEFIGAFTELVERFDVATDGTVRIASDPLLGAAGR